MRTLQVVPVLLLTTGLLLAINSCGGANTSQGRGTGGGVPTASTFLVVADAGANSVPVLALPSNGALAAVAGSPFLAGANPSRVAVAPNGRTVYVANNNSVSQFTINSSGTLAPITASVAATQGTPGAVVVDPTGKFLLVANQASQSISLFAIDQTTGALPTVANAIVQVNGNPVAMAMTGNFLYLTENNKIDGFTLNTSTGTLTPMAGTPFRFNNLFSNLNGMAIAPSGQFLYVCDSGANLVDALAINPTTGVPSTAGAGVAAGNDPVTLRFAPTGNFLYVANGAANTVTLLTANTTTGAIGTPATVATFTQPSVLTYDTTDNFLIVLDNTNHIGVFSVNTTSGALTAVAGSPFTVGTGLTDGAIAKP